MTGTAAKRFTNSNQLPTWKYVTHHGALVQFFLEFVKLLRVRTRRALAESRRSQPPSWARRLGRAATCTGTAGTPGNWACGSPTHGKSVQARGIAGKPAPDRASAGERQRIGASPTGANKNPSESTIADGLREWALRDSNPRPHGCDATKDQLLKQPKTQ